MRQGPEEIPWEKRLDAVGAAQSRYLWILLIAGIFYLSIGFATSPMATGEQAISTPILGLEISSTAVWASGPAVLSLLILVVIGSIRAAGVARRALNLQALGSEAEAFDSAPNAIDLAAYSTQDTADWVKWLLGLSYPAYLSVFLGQAAWQLVLLWQLAPARLWVVAVAAPSTVLAIWAGFMVIWFWRRRLPEQVEPDSASAD